MGRTMATQPQSPASVLVLSAGASSRMGTPKALLSLSGIPLLEQHIHAYISAGLKPVLVVLGHQADTLEQRLDLSGAIVVRNPDYRRGQFSSLREGLRASINLRGSSTVTASLLVTPVDCPPVAPRTL